MSLDVSAHDPQPLLVLLLAHMMRIKPSLKVLCFWNGSFMLAWQRRDAGRSDPVGSGCSGPRPIGFNSVPSSSHSMLNAAAH